MTTHSKSGIFNPMQKSMYENNSITGISRYIKAFRKDIHMTKMHKGMAAAFTGNFIFGLSFLFSTRAFDTAKTLLDGKTPISNADVPVVLAVRFIFAFVIMSIMIPLLRIKIDFKNKPVWKLLLLGTFQPVIYFIAESFGLKLTGIIVSSVMIALVPVVCQFFSALFLKEVPSFMQLICCLLSVAGVIAVTVFSGASEGNTYLAGIIFLVVAVLSAAAFNVLSRNAAEVFTPFERTYFMFIVSAVFFGAYALVATGFKTDLIVSPLKSGEFIVSIIYLGGFSSVGAYFMVNYANTYLPLARSTVFSNVITVVSTCAGFFAGEPFNLLTVAACVVIVIGIWGVQHFSGRKDADTAKK